MPTEWLELTIAVPPDFSEAVANFLMENGAPGLLSEEHDSLTTLIAYFATDPPLDALRRLCVDLGCLSSDSDDGVRVRKVADQDWAENWKVHFQPQHVGKHLFICPSWDTTAPPGRIAIVIDPGMAFGTGHHASTRGCLELLEWGVADFPVTRALDLGTGTGVLAIALAKLGVADVWAIDSDHTACTIAAENVERNHVDHCVRVRSDRTQLTGTFDLVTANLFANLLEDLAPEVGHSVRPDGMLICSGFLTADESRVHAAYVAVGFEVVRRWEEQSWVTLALHRKPL